MSSSIHNDNKKKNVLILDIGPTQGLDILRYQQKLNIQFV